MYTSAYHNSNLVTDDFSTAMPPFIKYYQTTTIAGNHSHDATTPFTDSIFGSITSMANYSDLFGNDTYGGNSTNTTTPKKSTVATRTNLTRHSSHSY
jgi:hypothetical protein